MKNFQQLKEDLGELVLNEAPVTAKQLEKVIVSGYNHIVHGEKGRDEESYRIYKSMKDVCLSYVRIIQPYSSRGDLMWYSGDGYGTLSPSWSGRDATYKTDMYLSTSKNSSKVKISLKTVGSQIVSAEKNEALSILNAVNSHYMRNNPDPNLSSLITGIQDGFGSIVTRMTAKELAFLASNPSNLVGEVLKYLELKNLHGMLEEKFNQYYSSSNEFQKWFVYEALSGNYKFGGGLGSANYLLIGDENGPVSMEKLVPSVAAKHASSVRIGVRFISHKRGRISTSLRGDLRDDVMKTNLISFLVLETNFLKESKMSLNENSLMTMIRKAFAFLMEKITMMLKKGLDMLLEFLGLEPKEIIVTGTLS